MHSNLELLRCTLHSKRFTQRIDYKSKQEFESRVRSFQIKRSAKILRKDSPVHFHPHFISPFVFFNFTLFYSPIREICFCRFICFFFFEPTFGSSTNHVFIQYIRFYSFIIIISNKTAVLDNAPLLGSLLPLAITELNLFTESLYTLFSNFFIGSPD